MPSTCPSTLKGRSGFSLPRKTLGLLLPAALVSCSSTIPTATGEPADAASGVEDAAPNDASPDIDARPPPFPLGHVYVAGSRNAEIFEFDSSLNLVSRWTHPSFGTVAQAPGQSYDLGPSGMVFDSQGNLVVAAKSEFCVFSAPGVLLACHPKIKAQATENIIFDQFSNLYTTTSTGGTNEIHKYNKNYEFQTTFSMPTGNLTGITCNPAGDLFIASQVGTASKIYKVDKTSLTALDTIDVTGTVEGLQYVECTAPGCVGGDLLAGTYNTGILRIRSYSPLVVRDTVSASSLLWPVPITTDNDRRLYTADYENGSGTEPADLWIFNAGGSVAASAIASPVYGPFGIVVAGAVLPCGAFQVE